MYLSCQAEGFCLFILSKVKSVHVCEKRKKKGTQKDGIHFQDDVSPKQGSFWFQRRGLIQTIPVCFGAPFSALCDLRPPQAS